ncbi:hypothetical protein MD484_g6516, partial [Candolleomyces efflorescens]
MDDETAEIELLQQNLNKTRQISKRVTSILDSFDTRIAKLEKSILPLYTTSQILNRRRGNIDKTLEKIDDVATREEDLSAEESLILRGQTQHPPPLHLPPYSAPHPHPHRQVPPARTLMDAQRGFADMRGSWSVKCLDAQGKRLVVRAGTSEVDPLQTGREFGEWVEVILGTADEEYRLLQTLAPLTPTSSSIASSFALFLSPLLRLFNSVLSSLVALMKKNLQRYSFLALSAYESLLSQQHAFELVLSYTTDLGTGGSFASSSSSTTKGGAVVGDKSGNEILKEGLTTLRSLCLRSFPEFLADIKLAALPSAVGKGGGVNVNLDVSTKVLDLTVETVKYISKIPEVEGAVSAALLALGDGNWKMGEGIQVGQKSKAGGDGFEDGGSDNVVLEHFIHDVIQTTLTSLQTISRPPSRRPAFGAIFLLNNVTYLRAFLPSTLLSPSTSELLQSNFRTAKAGYFDSNFTPLMQAISAAPSPSSGGPTSSLVGGSKSGQVKDKFARFYELFEEVVERHRVGRLLDEEGVGRERKVVEEEVVGIVVESFRRFCVKAGGKGKNPQKYIKKTPDDIEAEIRSLF